MKNYPIFKIATLSRNEPCSCGSRKKFKVCCGAPQSPPVLENKDRRCGSCTQCCNGWLKASIEGHEMYPGKACHFVSDAGCSIYETRPLSPCRKFVCAWIDPKSLFPDAFRPDIAGFIVVPIQWRGYQAYRMALAGNDPSKGHLDWMRDFSHRSGIPFFYEINGETIGYGPNAFVADLSACMLRGDPLW